MNSNSKILKTIVFLALFVPFGAIAQPTSSIEPSPTTDPGAIGGIGYALFEDEPIDIVTVGSLMPYKVDAIQGIVGLKVEYKWLFSFNNDPENLVAAHRLWAPQKINPLEHSPYVAPPYVVATPAPSTALAHSTLNPVVPADPPDNVFWYSANEVALYMPTTAGDVNLRTNVRYTNNVNALCEPDEVPGVTGPFTIRVIPRPKLLWTTTDEDELLVGTCEAADVIIPANVTTESEDVEVQIRIVRYEFGDYDDEGKPKPGADPVDLDDDDLFWIALSGTNVFNFPAATFEDVGLYLISVVNVTDRISRKSLDMHAVRSQAGDIPTLPFRVVVNPKPGTDPDTGDSTIRVNHVRNTPN